MRTMANTAQADHRKATGAHYTPPVLADFVASHVVKSWSAISDANIDSIADPAVGDGELLISLLRHLSAEQRSTLLVRGFDTERSAVGSANTRIRKAYPRVRVELECQDFLELALASSSDENNHELFVDKKTEQMFDLLIANPPYVRTQVMGASQAQLLARQFGLSGRVDLYFAFLLAIARFMKPGGIVGIIVSNRFMTTRAGAAVREVLPEVFDILHVWDLGDTKLFEAAVLPAVLLLQRKGSTCHDALPRFTSIYTTASGEPTGEFANAVAALNVDGVVSLQSGERLLVQQGTLDRSDVWRLTNSHTDKWLEQVAQKTHCTFADVGKVRVGVKTTADRVFTRTDWDQLPSDERPELLLPLSTHHNARRFKPDFSKRQARILYTHEVVQGKRVAVDLDRFPKARKYLEGHRSTLEGRDYVIKAGRQWYEIWVPQDPDAWRLPKVILRDIADTPTFWMDLDGTVVHGDCYWITSGHEDADDLLWLTLAVGNSTFAATFYDRRFHNKLYANRRRFMTQYVEQFPLPDPRADLSKKIVGIVKDLYDRIPDDPPELHDRLDELVWRVFGFSVEEIRR